MVTANPTCRSSKRVAPPRQAAVPEVRPRRWTTQACRASSSPPWLHPATSTRGCSAPSSRRLQPQSMVPQTRTGRQPRCSMASCSSAASGTAWTLPRRSTACLAPRSWPTCRSAFGPCPSGCCGRATAAPCRRVPQRSLTMAHPFRWCVFGALHRTIASPDAIARMTHHCAIAHNKLAHVFSGCHHPDLDLDCAVHRGKTPMGQGVPVAWHEDVKGLTYVQRSVHHEFPRRR